ncbi:ATP-dependent helicase HrpB [Aliihoeflea aestuarii]|jgi:ATP-dependent helicase HrpB|uniref:ATP-dependent helicase HrpB n=1 Tax=Aliihoeflea aestuarii TaxID=453840 RepID=UPI002092FCA4|nr:ATP-dependent helicase HrpB [Aliihoeflea aestuarii]MCO6391595.1 ATP-dependent helicase HrpB [Aliihoeflea aestuarii]
MTLPQLPVSEILGTLSDALSASGRAVLIAPPGAGKTTLVPLHLLQSGLAGAGKILLLEPRRLAARAAARRMASLLGEEVGRTVGYAMRMDSKSGPATRILVVTEGILARMILDDPELAGISAVLFDEFHERSLDGDFGLALALDVQAALRPDLKLLVMSATIDGARVASLLGDAPVVTSEGRSFPVETRYRERPSSVPIEDAMADAIRDALSDEAGSVLAFLPGQREIERTAERIQGRVPDDVDIIPLYGALAGKAQDDAIKPPPSGRRKVVLATSIAETSITIDGVRIVIDSGLSRVPKYEPSTGLTRLETVRVSRASADQRAGRAGRTEPGIAIRLWRAEQTAALPAFSTPEILEADLTGLILDAAAFGVTDPTTLAFLDVPPAAALTEARALLASLGALDDDGRLTDSGRRMRKLALPVRLAHMVTEASDTRLAAKLAVLLTERGLGGTSIDLDTRLRRFAGEKGQRADAARDLAKRLARQAGSSSQQGTSTGAALLLAYPDRVAKARGAHGHFVLANGRGGAIDAADGLASAPFIVVADLQGRAQNARIASAATIIEDEIRVVLGPRIETARDTSFDPQRGTVRVRETERLGSITLTERQLPAPKGADADDAIIDAVRSHGLAILPWNKGVQTLRARLGWLHLGLGEPWPAVDDDALVAALDDWLLPFLTGTADLARLPTSALHDGLMSLVPYDLHRKLETLAPTHYDAPSGSRLPVRYEENGPVLAIRVQELFGLDAHPSIAGGTVPMTLELLSPAHRPIQTTRDLPGFWRGSWADVRADMRGRYPKHHWPENPLEAQATARAKPRGT